MAAQFESRQHHNHLQIIAPIQSLKRMVWQTLICHINKHQMTDREEAWGVCGAWQ